MSAHDLMCPYSGHSKLEDFAETTMTCIDVVQMITYGIQYTVARSAG